MGPGHYWYYETYDIGTLEISYQGASIIEGRSVIVLLEKTQCDEQTRYNVFWSKDAQGNLYKHGSEDLLVFPGPPTWVHYEPPLLYLAQPSGSILGKLLKRDGTARASALSAVI